MPRGKTAVFISDAAATIIVKIMTLQQNLKKKAKQFEGPVSFFRLHSIFHKKALCATV
jgi:hypothetical protein